MTVIRIVAILLIFISCVIYGFGKSAKLTLKINSAKMICDLISDCVRYVRFEKLPVSVIVSRLECFAGYDKLDCFSQLKENMKISHSEFLSDEQIRIINKCFEKLRSGTRDEIIELLEDSMNELKIIYCSVAEQAQPKVTLYKKLGIIAGLFSCIILV